MENLDLTQILKDCPKGTKLYSPMAGFVTYEGQEDRKEYPIVIKELDGWAFCLTKDGKYVNCYEAECVLFPSRENRDWSTFKVEQPKFEPFQKVLVRDNNEEGWKPMFYSHYHSGTDYPHYCIGGDSFRYCIPYEGNEALLGTTDDPKVKED